jgi:hypothetical protein
MPNWCECDLYIEGPSEKIDQFLQLVKSEDSDFEFNRLVPYPEHFKKQDDLAAEWDKLHPTPQVEEFRKERPKDGYNQGGYEWCIEHWGTKWNAENPLIGERESWYGNTPDWQRLEINFDTAWSPPTPVIKRAAELFPELCFDLRYFEGGSMFNGMFTCEHGEVVTDESGHYFGNRGG